MPTGIAWCDETWNPVVGCSVLTPACTNCYAMITAGQRLDREGGPAHYRGTTMQTKAGPVWTGKVARAGVDKWTEPVRWKRGRRIFVNSMGDVFHENVPDEWVEDVLMVGAMAPQHKLILLTKRHERMRNFMNRPEAATAVYRAGRRWLDRMAKGDEAGPRDAISQALAKDGLPDFTWPLPNLWLGVTAEDQKRWDERIPALQATPAAVRVVSVEPMLTPIDTRSTGMDGLGWIIGGSESGRRAAVMPEVWLTKLLVQADHAGVPFFTKQLSGAGGRVVSDPERFPAHLQRREFPTAA